MAGPRPDLTQEAGLAKGAEEMLVAALESDEDGNRLFALTYLAGGVVPSSANAVLRELLGHANEQIEQLPPLHSLAAISLKRRTRQWGVAMPWRS